VKRLRAKREGITAVSSGLRRRGEEKESKRIDGEKLKGSTVFKKVIGLLKLLNSSIKGAETKRGGKGGGKEEVREG